MKIYLPPGDEEEFIRKERERLRERNPLYDPWLEPNAKDLLRLYLIGKLIIIYRKLMEFLKYR